MGKSTSQQAVIKYGHPEMEKSTLLQALIK